MLSWMLRKFSWKSCAIGAAVTVVGGSIARPILVQVVKAGMDLSSIAADAWNQAAAETAKIRAEASQQRAGQNKMEALLSEIRQLREDVAAVKSGFGTSRPS